MEKLLSLFTTESRQVIHYNTETSDRLVNKLSGLAERYSTQYRYQIADHPHLDNVEVKVNDFYKQLINIQTYLMQSWNEF